MKAIYDLIAATVADIEATEREIARINRKAERDALIMYSIIDMFVLLGTITLYII